MPLIDPFDETLLRPASYILRLGDTFRHALADAEVDVADQESLDSNFGPVTTSESLVLRQGEFVLGITEERVRVPPDLIGFIAAISNVGRIGLLVHATSPLINPGFGYERPSTLTLELASLNPARVRLHAGIPLCHVVFAKLTYEVSEHYDAVVRSLSGSAEPLTSRLAEDFAGHLPKQRER